MEEREIRKREKAAILLISLGKDSSAKILKCLSSDDIEKVTLEIANQSTIDVETKISILNEFYQECIAQSYMSEGGIEFAKSVLNEALGVQKSSELINKMTGYLKAKPFNFMGEVDQDEIVNFLNFEGNQTVALILSYLEPKQASAVLSLLKTDRQADIIKRIASMDKISPEIINDVEKVIKEKFADVVSSSYTQTEGIDAVVDILNLVDRSTEKLIFENLGVDNMEFVEEIKKRMFIFENIINLDNRSIQKFLSEVDNNDLAISLKVATEDVKNKIFNNLSSRVIEIIKDEIEMMGAVRLSSVEKSQQKIVNIIRKLDEKGEIIIRREGGDEIIE